MIVYQRGDIVLVSFNPSTGREMQGILRPALVLTTSKFNRFGDVLVAPITQGASQTRNLGFAVSLMGTGCQTQGVALVNKIRMMDLEARNAKKIERAPQAVIDDALARIAALFED